jgi:polyisoprenoid-binding protein YceI
VLSVTSAALRPDAGQLDGRLTLKSITQPVGLDINYLGGGAGPMAEIRAGFHASTQLDRDQFGMVWNHSLLAGVFAVGRTLRITIDVEAVYQQ